MAQNVQRSILGTLMIRPELYFSVSEHLRTFMFLQPFRQIAEKMFETLETGEKVNLHQLADAFPDHTKEVLELHQYSDSFQFLANCETLKTAYLRQETIQILQKSAERLTAGEELEEVVSDCNNEQELLKETFLQVKDDLHSDLMATMDQINETMRMREEGKMTGITTGIPQQDRLFYGWQKGDYVILAARPGLGKTTLALDYLLAAAQSNIPVLFISLEMTRQAIYMKLASKLSGVPVKSMRRGLSKAEHDQVWKSLEVMYDMPLRVLDTKSISSNWPNIRDRIRMLHRRKGYRLIIIDYLQLIQSGQKTGNRNQQLEEVSRQIKSLAVEIDGAIIALCQLNRSGEQSGNRRPMLWQLRDSGSLEQDTDVVQFLYRDNYYDHETSNLDVELIIAKNRMSGEMGTIQLSFDPKANRYSQKDIEFSDVDFESTNALQPMPEGDLQF